MQNEKTQKNKKLSAFSAEDKRKFPFVYLMLLFPVAQMLVFWFYVNLSGIAMAFQDANGNWSLDSFRRVINGFVSGSDTNGFNLLSMLGKSVFIWVQGNVISWIVGLVITYILAKHMIGSKFFRVVYMIPGLLGSVLTVAIFKNLYDYNGIITQIVKRMGIDLPPVVLRNGLLASEKTAFITIQLQGFIWGLSGGNLIITGAYMRIPDEIFESATLEGCGFFRECFQIAIPCVWSTLSTMMIFSLCGIFTADSSFYLYSSGTGGRGLNSIGFYLYYMTVDIARGSTDYGYPSAFGLFITFITIPMVILGSWLLGKIQEDVEF